MVGHFICSQTQTETGNCSYRQTFEIQSTEVNMLFILG